VSDTPHSSNRIAWDTLARADVLSGLLFIAVAALGLWISRDYAVGTALRMGTGYVPRLLCWMLMGLGAIVLVQGLRDKAPPVRPSAMFPALPPAEPRSSRPRCLRARRREAFRSALAPSRASPRSRRQVRPTAKTRRDLRRAG